MICLWAVILASGADYDPDEVIQRVKLKVLANVKSVPNYTCVETVSRDYFRTIAMTIPRTCAVLMEERRHRTLEMNQQLYSRDRLRLDVTMASRGEVFSWVGAKQFVDGSIDHVVRSGPMSTGSFAGFLTAVFKTDVKKLIFSGTGMAGTRVLLQYAFQVQLADSHYRVQVPDSWVTIDYGGTIDVDPETAEVVRMSVITGELPSASGMCQTSSTMEFAKVRIGDGQFLLPRRASNHYVYPNGEEVENTTDFGNCREFHGESTLTFGPYEGAADGVPKNALPLEPSVTAGMPFSMALTSAIATDKAAAGDSFSAKLADAVRDGRGKVILAKGTPVEGHVLRVQSYVRPPAVIVVLRPEAFRIRGERVTINAIRDWNRVQLEYKGRGKKGMEIIMTESRETYAQAFRFEGAHVIVPSGFRSEWQTSAQKSVVPSGTAPVGNH